MRDGGDGTSRRAPARVLDRVRRSGRSCCSSSGAVTRIARSRRRGRSRACSAASGAGPTGSRRRSARATPRPPRLARGEFEPWARETGARWALAGASHCRALLAVDAAEATRLFESAPETAWRCRRGRSSGRGTSSRSGSIYGGRASGGRGAGASGRCARWVRSSSERPSGRSAHGSELRASGQTTRTRDASTRDELTPQELQIARFVGEGLTNREVAAQLFVSPRHGRFPSAQRVPRSSASRRGRSSPGSGSGVTASRSRPSRRCDPTSFRPPPPPPRSA